MASTTILKYQLLWRYKTSTITFKQNNFKNSGWDFICIIVLNILPLTKINLTGLKTIYTCTHMLMHTYIHKNARHHPFFLKSQYLSFLHLKTLTLLELPVNWGPCCLLPIQHILAFLNYKSSSLLSNCLSICLFFFTLFYDQPNLGTNPLNIYNCLPASSLSAPSKSFWTLLVGESLKQNFKLVTFFPKKLFKGWITMSNILAI